MALYRVANLRGSRDKRLQRWTSNYKARTRGAVGNIFPGYGEMEEIVMMKDLQNNPAGIYRLDELELVTEQQLKLEMAILGLLTIFPNSYPESVLGLNSNEDDEVVTSMAVNELRWLLKNHPLIQLRSLNRRFSAVEDKEYALVKELQKTSRKADRLENLLVRGLQAQLSV